MRGVGVGGGGGTGCAWFGAGRNGRRRGQRERAGLQAWTLVSVS